MGALRKLAIPLAALLFTLPANAQGANVTVSVGDNFFNPDEIRIEPGDTVTWKWTGLDEHTVTSYMSSAESFDSGSLGQGATFPHTFNKRGRFQYFCKPHPVEMDSVVQVGEPLPPPAPDIVKPSLSGLRAKHKRLCSRRGRGCRRRSTKLVFKLSEDATVRVKIARRSRPGRTLKSYKRSLRKGKRSLPLSAKGLRPGRYVAAVRAEDAAGNDSLRKRVRFRVVKPPASP